MKNQHFHVVQRTGDTHFVGRRAWADAPLPGEIEGVTGEDTPEARAVLKGVADALTLQLRLESKTPAAMVMPIKPRFGAAAAPENLTPDQVRATIERAGVGDSFSAKVSDVATRADCAESTVYKWLSSGTDGTRARAARGLLRQIACEHEVFKRPDDGSGVMMI